ncbi:MAG: GDSL-type esterase/lipase family protein [Pseudomonadota bacterium]
MNIRVLILILFCNALIACSETNQPAILSSDATILAFGDSLTYGTGAHKGEDYPSILSSLTGLKVINAGVPGEISNEGLQRLPSLLDEYQPDLLILIHGGNDILRKLPRAELKNNLLAMFDLANKRSIPVVNFGVPEPGLFLKSAETYQQLVNETDVPIELKLLPDIIGDKSLKADIAHPNAKGYRKLAEGIFEFLQEKEFVEN